MAKFDYEWLEVGQVNIYMPSYYVENHKYSSIQTVVVIFERFYIYFDDFIV